MTRMLRDTVKPMEKSLETGFEIIEKLIFEYRLSELDHSF